MPVAQADTHQAGQEALAGLAVKQVQDVWSLLDIHNLSGTSPQLMQILHAVITRYGSASSAAALDYYRQLRADQVQGRRVALKVAPPIPVSKVDALVQPALTPLYGPVDPAKTAAAQDATAAVVEQLVLDQGRDTILDNVARDPAAKGWARTTEVGACSFCIMLALRAGQGLLYRSAKVGGFQAHNNCRCNIEPVFTSLEPSHRMRTMQGLWASSTKGLSGEDARRAFRQAVEHRTPPH
jgi:hypothetical protein